MRIRDALSTLLPLLTCSWLLAHAQAVPTEDLTASDITLSAPNLSTVGGMKDAAALALLSKAATRTGSDTWPGLQVRGTMTYESNPDHPCDALLTVLDDGHTRLDITTPDGMISSRFSGPTGALQINGAPVQRIDVRDALRGLMVFPSALQSSPSFSRLALKSQGEVTVDGAILKRVALSRPLPASVKSEELNTSAIVTDLYFSTATGQLVKSVDMVHMVGRPGQLYKRVVTYSDYQTTEGVMLPMKLDLTMNGQHIWSLRISSASVTSAVPGNEYFTF